MVTHDSASTPVVLPAGPIAVRGEDPAGPATDDRIAAAPDLDPADVGEPALAPVATPLARLGEAVINGLVHCACSHHMTHPDLLTIAIGETDGTVPVSRGRAEDDAG